MGRKYLRLVPGIVGMAALSAYAVQPAACAAIEARIAATSSHPIPCCSDEHSEFAKQPAERGADEERDREGKIAPKSETIQRPQEWPGDRLDVRRLDPKGASWSSL